MTPSSSPTLRSRLTQLLFYFGVPAGAGFLLGTNHAGIAFYMTWPLALLYWISLSVGLWWTAELCARLSARILRPWQPAQWLVLVCGMLLASAVGRPFIYWWTAQFEPSLLFGRTVRPMPALQLSLAFATQFLQVWSGFYLLWLGANYFFDRVIDLPRFRNAASPDTAEPASANKSDNNAALDSGRFISRIPTKLGSAIVALKAEDHYVQVYTELGHSLVLYRMTDAIRELTQYRGLRVHRSWWINIAAVRSLQPVGRSFVVRLSNGLEVPVSQAYKELVRQSGLDPKPS